MQAEEQKAEHAPSLTISADDLDAALRLLEDEERAASTGQRVAGPLGVINAFLGYTFVYTLFCTLGSGLLVVWFNFWWGCVMLAGAAISLFLLFVFSMLSVSTPRGDMLAVITTVRGEIGEGEFAKASDAVFKKHKNANRFLYDLVYVLIFPAVLSFPFALWFSSETFILLSLLAQGLWAVAAALILTREKYAELQYLTRVSKLRARFEARAQQGEQVAGGGVAVTPKEMELLGRAETKRAVREAAKVMEASATEAES